MGDSQAGLRDEVLTSPDPGGDNAMDGGQFWRPTSAPLPSSTQRPPFAPAPAVRCPVLPTRKQCCSSGHYLQYCDCLHCLVASKMSLASLAICRKCCNADSFEPGISLGCTCFAAIATLASSCRIPLKDCLTTATSTACAHSVKTRIRTPEMFNCLVAAAGAAAIGGHGQEAAADALHEVRDLLEAAAEEGVPAQQGAALCRQPRRARRAPATCR